MQPPKTIVSSTYYSRFNLRLVYAAGVYLFTWTDFYDTLALRFDANLNPLDTAPVTLVTGYGLSGLASNGSQFFITWVDQLPPDYIIRVKGARISTDGVVLDGAGLSISGNNQPTAVHDHWRSLGWHLLASDLGIQQRGLGGPRHDRRCGAGTGRGLGSGSYDWSNGGFAWRWR